MINVEPCQPLKQAIRQFRVDYVRAVIEACGSKNRAAKVLKIERSHIYRILSKKYPN